MARDNYSIFDQYSGVRRLVGALESSPSWVTTETDRMRLSAYTKYEEIYWNDDRAFQLLRRGVEQEPIVVPNAMTVCDTTAHYLLKGMDVTFKDGSAKSAVTTWMQRQKFASKFAIAKHTGVVRGDWIFHITVDESAEDGDKVQLTSVDPGAYFPIHDPDNLDKIIKVILAEAFEDADGEERVKKRTYALEKVGGKARVSVHEEVYENELKWRGSEPAINRVIEPEHLLPEEITHIPVYHFKNRDWQGQPYGSSEIRGFERILSSIDQTISDEELTLALEGLGVYATDAGAPRDDQGNEEAWEISPAKVLSVPGGTFFKRVEGVQSVKPMLDHVNWLQDRTYEASATFRAGTIEAAVAETGIALAIRFLPTQAKIEERDLAGSDETAQMFLDWTFWQEAYEGANFGGKEPTVTLGSKLPLNREERVSELNNMLDRHVISIAFYRLEMNKLGYEIPENIQDEIDAEMEHAAEFQLTSQGFNEPEADPNAVGPDGKALPSGNPSNPNQPTLPRPGNQSNNKGRTNESNGTEAKQPLRRQQRPAR